MRGKVAKELRRKLKKKLEGRKELMKDFSRIYRQAKKLVCITITILFITTNVYAARLKVPFRCYKKTLIEEFRKVGIYLDDEDENADGCILNYGGYYEIVTYRMIANYQPFIDIPKKVERMKNGNRDTVFPAGTNRGGS